MFVFVSGENSKWWSMILNASNKMHLATSVADKCWGGNKWYKLLGKKPHPGSKWARWI